MCVPCELHWIFKTCPAFGLYWTRSKNFSLSEQASEIQVALREALRNGLCVANNRTFCALWHWIPSHLRTAQSCGFCTAVLHADDKERRHGSSLTLVSHYGSFILSFWLITTLNIWALSFPWSSFHAMKWAKHQAPATRKAFRLLRKRHGNIQVCN